MKLFFSKCGCVSLFLYAICLGCSKSDDSRDTRLTAECKILLGCIQEFKKDKGILPKTLEEAYAYLSNNLRGEFDIKKWKYVLSGNDYILICRSDSQSVVISVSGNTARVVELPR